MALQPNPVADEIAAFVQANKPAPGSPVTTDQLKALWEGIMGKIYPDITANAEVMATIPASSINTAGSPAAQVGPPAPVNISGTVS